MISINLDRSPVEVGLSGAFDGVQLTLRRLTSVSFAQARAATMNIVSDAERLETVMVANDLLPDGGVEAWRRMGADHPERHAAFLGGVSVWIGQVECATRAIADWTGIATADGEPVRVSREAIESLMLNEDACRQIGEAIDRAAVLISTGPKLEIGS